ncbi:MAG: hypothetical protein HQ592_13550 [Planctomycetes bacterium]|nr:hypothetical protein [Planctomycetota bacterium]
MIDRFDSQGTSNGQMYQFGGGSMAKNIVVGVVVVVLAAGMYVWTYCRIQVGEEQFVPLLKKTGTDITNEMLLVGDPKMAGLEELEEPGDEEPLEVDPKIKDSDKLKGPRFQILEVGRHFRNPYYWWWPKPMAATVIPDLKVGVLVRKYGRPLPPGQVLATTADEKGILEEPLGIGRHFINTWAYKVEQHPMVKLKPGYMGVVTRLVGDPPEDPNVFVVNEGERGTQPFLLPPGTHPKYSNPYMCKVTAIDVRSQKFEMAGVYGVTFPSRYGFDIKVEGIIEWAPDIDKLPELFVKYVDETDLVQSGGINNIQRKLILPFARSYFRTIGGQHRAVDYITGDTRIKVQNQVQQRLKESCAAEGVIIRSFVIRATEPPRRIRDQYERREISKREMDRYRKEIETQIGTVILEGGEPELGPNGEPLLDERGNPKVIGATEKLGPDGKPLREGGRVAKVIEERRKDRESQRGEVRAGVVTEIRAAEQYKAVEVTRAQKELAVAKVMLEAAKDRAAKILAEGTAQAAVTVMKNKAEANAVEAKVSAFETGDRYAEYQLIKKLSPGIRKILSNTEGSFARLFERFASMGEDDDKADSGE